MRYAIFNLLGRQVPDPEPKEIPLSARRPESLRDQVQAMVQSELRRYAELNNWETPEEADDFEVDDDPDPRSDYEYVDMEPEEGPPDPPAPPVDPPPAPPADASAPADNG